MRLCMALLKKYHSREFPRGSMWIGKYRLVKPLGAWTRASQLNKLAGEYENMKLLAKPYLTEEQEASQPDWDQAIADRAKYERERLALEGMEHITIEDHLARLDTRKWE